MKFSKDILLIDIEATGIDIAKHEMIQLAAIRLDKKTLKEKAAFSSFIRPLRWKTRQPEAMAVNKITFDMVKGASLAKDVVKEFRAMFPAKDVILANYGGILDITFLRKTFEHAGLAYEYDYHVFNLWGLCYAYLAKHGKFTNKKKFAGFGLEDFGRMFRLSSQTHDALDDCRLEADVLRQILKKM